jgi:predicted PhzF superfamily epimerase YddE/YHI9
VPEFAAKVLGVSPLACAEAGGPADYLIVELPDADAVRELQPDFAGLSAATQRAVIVTAVAEHSGHPGCVFRYFAPRYGTSEDAATGSAAVQLAAFWSPRLAGPRFQARQLSLQGAEMWLACNGNVVELTARVGYC